MLKKLTYLLLCLMILRVSVIAQDYEIAPCNFNSDYNDFAPAFFGDNLIFCSDKKVRVSVNYIDESGNFPSSLYKCDPKSNRSPELLDPQFMSKFNTGPCFYDALNKTLWYTKTITHKGKKALGLFYIHWSEQVWGPEYAFAFNSEECEYSLSYPHISYDGRFLFMSSDKAGGYGGKDLYYCTRNEYGWNAPVNVGPSINTACNEISPYTDNRNNLYFSSNKNDGATDYNLFVSYYQNNNYESSQKLPAPINSEYDDFALITDAKGETGYFTSNRKNAKDDIYSFKLNYPLFENCPPIEKPSFCYLFEETEIVPNDTMPMIFEWDFGDGSRAKGLSAEHCYKDYGSYHVALNVFDSLTKAQFARVSEVDVFIARSPYPYINSEETALTGKQIRFDYDISDMTEFEIDKVIWDFGDGMKTPDSSAIHAYSTPGYYTVTVGFVSPPVEGMVHKTCATRIIAVGTPEELAALNSSDNEQWSGPSESFLQNDMLIIEDNADSTKLKYVADSTLYYVQFKTSEEQMPRNDPYFENIKYEITERYDDRDTLYKYSVGYSDDAMGMIKVYRELVAAGYSESILNEKKIEQFNRETVKQWWYIPDSLEAGMNRHLNKFNDIRFNYNDYRISENSFADLKYISQVLLQQPALKLEIIAHTDSIGSEDHNRKLSLQRAEEVVNYLVSAGVHRERLKSTELGESKPLGDNGTEKGRAENRRVEFLLIREK